MWLVNTCSNGLYQLQHAAGGEEGGCCQESSNDSRDIPKAACTSAEECCKLYAKFRGGFAAYQIELLTKTNADDCKAVMMTAAVQSRHLYLTR